MRIPVIDPATGAEIATVADANEGRCRQSRGRGARRVRERPVVHDAAGRAARRCSGGSADLIDQNADELAELESLDNGKTKFMASVVDVPGARNYFRYMAGWATKIEGSTIEVSIGAPEGRPRQRVHAPRARRRRRADHPVELPARDGRVEARAGARGRLHVHFEARGADAAHGAAARRAHHRGRLPARRRQHSHGLRRDDRRRAREAPGRRQDRVHGLDRGRQAHQQSGHRHAEARVARARRQVAGHRAAGRRSRTP